MNVLGLTPDEYFNYVCQDEEAKKFFEIKCTEIDAYLQNHIEGVGRKVESLSEQIGFAQQTLEEIEAALERETKMSQFKKTFKRILEESFFDI